MIPPVLPFPDYSFPINLNILVDDIGTLSDIEMAPDIITLKKISITNFLIVIFSQYLRKTIFFAIPFPILMADMETF